MKNSCFFFVKLLIEIFNKNSMVREKFTAFCIMGYCINSLFRPILIFF